MTSPVGPESLGPSPPRLALRRSMSAVGRVCGGPTSAVVRVCGRGAFGETTLSRSCSGKAKFLVGTRM